MRPILMWTVTVILVALYLASSFLPLLYVVFVPAVFEIVAQLLWRGGKERQNREKESRKVAKSSHQGYESSSQKDEQEVGITLRDREELEEKYEETKKELDELRSQLKEWEQREEGYARQCIFIAQAVESEKILSQIVEDKTENATKELTDHTYSLAGSSRQVGEIIQEALGHVTAGKGGLKDDVERLQQELETIKNLITEFQQIRDGYTSEMETIEATMKEVDSFTDTITDLAERTSVLAINASIEAARAGSAGKGFAVIAGEVQKLAGNTKNIAEQINSTVEESVYKVKNSIEQYGSRIEESVNQLERSGKEHSELIEQLNPQIEKISEVVSRSQELSETVTNDLNEVTVHLQYQDTVRQVLEHMMGVLEKITEKGREMTGDPKKIEPREVEQLQKEMNSLVTGFFTTREEWEAFGYSIQEDLEEKKSTSNDNTEEELAGDVTLF